MDTYVIQKAESPYSFFPEKFELQFYQAFRNIKALGCDYFYFLGLDGATSYRFCTHEHWMESYHTEKFISDDPLKRLAENTKFLILPWEQLTHIHGGEKRTMDGRTSFGLFHGLTMVREHNHKKYIFALATECKEHDLARYFLLEKTERLEEFSRNCLRQFDQYTSLMFCPAISI